MKALSRGCLPTATVTLWRSRPLSVQFARMATQAPGVAKTNWRLILAKSVGVGAGIMLTLALLVGVGVWYTSRPLKASDWVVVTSDFRQYLSDAIFSDLGVPDFKTTGRVKFIPPPGDSSDYQIGYVLELDMKPLDMSKVPEKYKHPEVHENYTIGGLSGKNNDQATYKIKFSFTLKDKDGFVLQTIDGKEHYVESGGKQTIQDLTEGRITPAIYRRVATVTVHSLVETCSTCTK